MSESKEQLLQTYPIGSRVRLTDQSIGTLKYVGEVSGHPGLWMGIDWDDATRGKHDGSVDGIQYFTASEPTSGSMVRPGKLATRVSLRHAIEFRYILKSEHVLDDRLVAETQKMLHATLFEIVGMDKIKEKQSHWDDLEIVAIEESNVYMAGILTQLVNLTELHLTASLISSWGTVADILKQVPSLKSLNLSENYLLAPSEFQIAEYRPHFQNLKSLNLRKCNLKNWQNVLHVSRMWPGIETLALPDNDLMELTEPDTNKVFSKLQNLDLQMNKISNFQDIINLGRLNTLKHLNLGENEIQVVKLPECEPNEWVNVFRNLVEINLKDNPIKDDAATFNELDKLRSLETLMYTIPNTGGFEEIFSSSVSRIPRLKVLNSMILTGANKRGAEYDLWKAYGAEWITAGETGRKEVSLKCRAYPHLVEKYGSPADVSSVAPKISNLITIQMQTSNRPDQLPIRKRVSRKMSVQALQAMAIKLLSDGALLNGITMPRLSYLDQGRSDLKIPMDNLSKSLDYYSMQEGDVVVVDW